MAVHPASTSGSNHASSHVLNAYSELDSASCSVNIYLIPVLPPCEWLKNLPAVQETQEMQV